MQKKIYTYILLIFVAILHSCGSVNSLMKKGDDNFQKGAYAVAGNYYKRAYSGLSSKQKPLRAKAAFLQGECYRKMNFYRAEQSYQNAVRNQYPDSIVYLRLAQMEQKNGKLKEAEKNYSIYLKAYPDDELGRNGLISIHLSDSLQKNPSRYQIKKEKDFNVTSGSTFSPAFASSESDALVFTSNRKFAKKDNNLKKNNASGQPNNHLFMMKKNSQGKWEKPEVLEGEMTTKNDEGVSSFTADGSTMYFTRSLTEDSKGQGTMILSSTRSGGEWSAPQSIKLFNDSSISVAHPVISPDGKTLYFVSDNKSGFGGKDIWMATQENGKWDDVVNLGKEINSAGDEMFPSVDSKGTLYYSSNGKPGLGGLDIFKAEKVVQKDGTKKWEITNLGIPMNSTGDDFGMTFAKGEVESGYFSSNREDQRGFDAIWSFVLPAVEFILQGKISGQDGNPVTAGKINLVCSDGETARINAKGDGSYRIKLKPNVSYLIQASAQDYLNESDSLSTFQVNLREGQTFTKNFQLTPTLNSVKIDNIYYDFDKATLRPESKAALDRLIQMMNEHPNITIELSAHTDYKGNNDYNRDLSARRAQSVVDYLIKAGIDGARLKAVGYGKLKPYVVDATTAKNYDFLPQGTELTQEFIETLTPEQQETANQINRRTEFKILSTSFGLY